MTREEEDLGGLSSFSSRGRWAGTSAGTPCPVCMKIVPGELDVVEAHVDACLTHVARMQEEREHRAVERSQQDEYLGEVDIDEDVTLLATDGASLRGKLLIVMYVVTFNEPCRLRVRSSGSWPTGRG